MATLSALSWRLLLASAVIWGATPLGGLAWADEDEAVASEEATVEEQEDDDVDPLAVPEGNAKEIVAHIQKLATMKPEGESELAKLRYQTLVFRAIADAAEKGLEADPSDQEAHALASFRFMALQQLEKTAKQEYDLAIKEARTDERAPVAAAGWRMTVAGVVGEWDKKSDDEKAAFREMLIGDFPMEPTQAAARAGGIRTAVAYLERSDADFAKGLMEDAVVELAKSDDESVKKVADQLAGTLRRMNLMGNEMELHGQLLGGEEFDWASYRGKVVLVDFWATWCGPCIAEIPNVKEQYEAYHEKGFDVVGISLDDSAEKVEKFLADREVPWPTLFGGPAGEDDLGWNQPMARYYGVSGIPTAILVDQEGRVVSMRARGPELKEELQKLLGDPATKEEQEETEAGDGEPAEESAGS
jgi:thiol-disulfide isomerase/thioredoxin